MKILTIPAGSEVMIGAPAKPMNVQTLESLRSLLMGIPEVEEAHLPQMFAPGAMEKPGQVLVVVLKDGTEAQAVMEKLDVELKKILPDPEYLDIFPVNLGNVILKDVRNSDCRIK